MGGPAVGAGTQLKTVDDILELVGETPLLELARYSPEDGGAIERALGRGSLVVTIFPDGFERYLGNGVFENI